MLYDDLGKHDRSCPNALTKVEIGALLTRGASAAEVTCIGEFSGVSSWVTGSKGKWKERDLDYVWAVRSTDKCPSGADCHGSKWIVLAAFEVEGYPCGADKNAPEKDADSLSIIARDTKVQAPDIQPILSLILFTVHPSGTRPWAASDTFASLDARARKMKEKVSTRIGDWIQQNGLSTMIETLVDKELIADSAKIDTWVTATRTAARDLRKRGLAR